MRTQADRRRTARHGAVEGGIARARVRPGHQVDVVDVSAGGILVESDRRLMPGASVDVQLEAGGGKVVARGRVVRCAVARLRGSSVCYRGAISFDHHLPWLAEGEQDGYGLPRAEVQSGALGGVAATRRGR